MAEWETKRLGDLVKFYSGGTPNKKIDSYWNGNIPWISAKTMKSDRIRTSELFITEEGLEHGSKIAPVGSLLLLVRGSGLFNGIPVCYVEEPVAYNQDIKCIQSCSEIENEYIYYWLKANSDFLQKSLDVTGIGAGKFDTKFLSELEVSYPDKETRRKIIAFANNLTEKLLVNEQINRNLSEQLEALYLDQFSADCNGALSDLCEYTKERIDVESLSEETYYSTENMLPNKAGATVASGLPTTGKTPACFPGNILISNIRPYFKKIVYCHEEAGCSADVLCFVAKNPMHASYLYTTLYVDKFFDYMVAGSKGTKMPRGDKQQIMQYPVHIPTDAEIEGFGSMANDILRMIHSNTQENKRLEAMRDSLLPKLMSGELDVSDLEI